MPVAPFPKDIRKLLAFGAGVGIQIGAADLEVAAARVRPSSIHVLGRTTLANFASRPAAEWGMEYARFLKSLGLQHVSATVLLPRREIIARHVALPGVAPGDMENAIRFDLDSLHPYGDEEICWGWSPLGKGAALVGIARKSAIDRYVEIFAEAGIAVASFTFPAAAIHAAIRLNGHSRGARDSSRSAAPPRAASRFMAKARRGRCSPPNSISRRSAPRSWRSPNCGFRRIPPPRNSRKCCRSPP